MKLITFAVQTPFGEVQRTGALHDGSVAIDLAAACTHLLHEQGVTRASEIASALIPADMTSYLSGWPVGREAGEKALAYAIGKLGAGGLQYPRMHYLQADYVLKAPLRPGRIRDYLTFDKKNAMERRGQSMPSLWYEMPTYTNRNHTALAGPDEKIEWPSYSQMRDVEFEIGLIVGKKGRDIDEERAREYICGFTIYNDLSARDVQAKERICGSGPGKSKDFDQSNIIGPCIATIDEIEGDDIEMVFRINGKTLSKSSTKYMSHGWARLIANASRNETIYPGDLIASGTMNGGCCAELEISLEAGSIVEMEAIGIGTLRNQIA